MTIPVRYVKTNKIINTMTWTVLPLVLFLGLLFTVCYTTTWKTASGTSVAVFKTDSSEKGTEDTLNQIEINKDEGKNSEIIANQTDRGFWIGKEAIDNNYLDKGLVVALVDFFNKENASSVIDLGAGIGLYAKEMMAKNIFVSCYDGNPNTIEISEGRCATADLSKPINFVKYDWAMSIEVGEHIPKIFEHVFLENLSRVSKKGVILSWSIVGQGGHKHINNQNNEYIKRKMRAFGYTVDSEQEHKFRAAAVLPWLKKTVMVFRKPLLP